jgi:hypothetical protein
MKKYFNKISVVLLILAFVSQSCTKDFEEINTNPNTSPFALPQQFLAPALINSVTTSQLRNRNFNNELMQVTVDISDADGKVFRYDYRNTWADYTWNNFYAQLTNFKDLYRAAEDPVNYNQSYMGIALVSQAWLYASLTDIYGDIPYSEALMGRDSNLFEPKFDTQKDIYLGLFEKLEEANTRLKAGTAIEGGSDPLFNGSVAKWRKFGNALYLRLLMRIAHKAETSDFVLAKIKEIAETNTAAYPMMSSNDDSAILKWTGNAPLNNPYISVRQQDFRAPSIGSFFIDNLVDWNDPRINIPLYGSNGINRWRIATTGGQYIGVPSGYAPGEDHSKKSYFYSNDQYNESLQNEPLTGMIMNYAELQFILAEASLKGYINKVPSTYYKAGVLSAITLWIPTWPVATDVVTNVDGYLANADMAWDDANTFEEKMQKIHLQKYYALFLTGFEQWFEYRRTGYPKLPIGAGLKNNGEMPSRMTYPVYVQSTNPTNYKLVVQNQGADNISTKVWWQKP